MNCLEHSICISLATGSKWWEHTRLTLTAAAITPRMKRAQRDCCYGTMTPISFPHHKKYCAFPIRPLNWFLGTEYTMYLGFKRHFLLSSFFYWNQETSWKIGKFILLSVFFPLGMLPYSKKKFHFEICSLNELISPTFEYILCILPVHSIWIKFVFLTPLFLIRFLPICTQKVWVRFKPFTLLLIHF